MQKAHKLRSGVVSCEEVESDLISSVAVVFRFLAGDFASFDFESIEILKKVIAFNSIQRTSAKNRSLLTAVFGFH